MDDAGPGQCCALIRDKQTDSGLPLGEVDSGPSFPATSRASLNAMTTLDEIRVVLEAKAEALIGRKADHLDALLHNDFVYVNAGGRTFDKASYIEAYCTSGRVVFTHQGISDLMVKLIDGFVVATLSINDELRIDGRPVSGRYQSLCVFNQSAGHWLWTAGQTMAVGAS